MATPRDKRTHELWVHELEDCDKWIPRIESEARAYANMADTIQGYAPELAQTYRELAQSTRERAQRAKERKQRIIDYLAGRIGPWW